MSRRKINLLIVSRDALLDLESTPQAPLIYRQLSGLNRRGFNLLLTASAPDKWVPTRGNVDNALKSQQLIQRRLRESGGDFDGVYYVRRSLLTQDRNRAGALKDILQRYGLQPDQALLMSSSLPFLRAAERLGIQTMEVTPPVAGKGGNLLELVNSLA